uniref:CST complex subunit CTC1 n=1 Tax=Steinernema glaseri TaxID=37863 RepID=A0A1I8AJ70_9BILA
KLTSFWDLHATLLSILGKEPPYNSHNGHSLLKELPENRNCQSADIPEEQCVCQREISANISDPKVVQAAEKLLGHINAQLPPQCAQLRTSSIKHAQMIIPNKKIALGRSSFFGGSGSVYVDYRVTLEASPSGAVFEGILRNALEEGSFVVVGDISRINKYGNQSRCVNTQTLKKFCYCLP